MQWEAGRQDEARGPRHTDAIYAEELQPEWYSITAATLTLSVTMPQCTLRNIACLTPGQGQMQNVNTLHEA